MTTGEKIRDMRKSRRMTLQELANKLNCSQSAISQYERGTRQASAPTLAKIANALQCPVWEITGNADMEQMQQDTNLLYKATTMGNIPGTDNASLNRTQSVTRYKELMKKLGIDLTPSIEVSQTGKGESIIFARVPVESPSAGTFEYILPDHTQDLAFESVFAPIDRVRTALRLLERMNAKGQERAISYLVDLAKVPDYQYDPDAES